MDNARRWPARPLSKEASPPVEGYVCATVWPTRALNSTERWFDELYFWSQGFEASTTQRARIQWGALLTAFSMLEHERTDHVGITVSFGTVERFMDEILEGIEEHALVNQRICLMLRGSVQRLRSSYRLRAFVDYLRAHQIPVGYRSAHSRITMELASIDFVQPSFCKILAPSSLRPEFWHDFVLEARVAGIDPEHIIIAGLNNEQQIVLARDVGIGFGQGSAVRPAYLPPEHVQAGSAIFAAVGEPFALLPPT
jgi:hypothetical protein